MKNYFTISEFARLRNININSLRYYEKIGILKPVRIDPNTGYRYYCAEQLSVLDTILLCIDLNIPLKELVNYIDENGMLHSQSLFEEGKRLAQQQIRKIQTGLSKIEYALQDVADSSAYAQQRGVYQRLIRSRKFLISEYTGSLESIQNLEKEFTRLHQKAQAKNLAPIFPAGMLLQYQGQTVRCFLLSEIVDRQSRDENILEIPQGEFLCVQAEPRPAWNLLETVERYFSGLDEKTVLVTNLMLDKYNLDNRKSELQVTARQLI